MSTLSSKPHCTYGQPHRAARKDADTGSDWWTGFGSSQTLDWSIKSCFVLCLNCGHRKRYGTAAMELVQAVCAVVFEERSPYCSSSLSAPPLTALQVHLHLNRCWVVRDEALVWVSAGALKCPGWSQRADIQLIYSTAVGGNGALAGGQGLCLP